MVNLTRLVQFLFVEGWAMTLTLALGAAAVYFLLPRPRGYPLWWGVLAGAAALVLAGASLVRVRAATAESVLFYAFSAIALVAGVLLITQRNPARAALSFALVVLSTCGLFLLLAAPFLMAATIIIYAGAIIVTFLFVLMLAQQEGRSDADYRSREPLLSAVAGFVLLGALLYVLRASYDTGRLEDLIRRTDTAVARLDALEERRQGPSPPAPQEIQETIQGMRDLLKDWQDEGERRAGVAEYGSLRGALDDWENFEFLGDVAGLRDRLDGLRRQGDLLAATQGTVEPPERAGLSDFSGPAANLAPSQVRRDEHGRPQLPAENTTYLGRSLFTDYLLAVELAGTLLLVATVGAIAIANRRPGAAPTPGRLP